MISVQGQSWQRQNVIQRIIEDLSSSATHFSLETSVISSANATLSWSMGGVGNTPVIVTFNSHLQQAQYSSHFRRCSSTLCQNRRKAVTDKMFM